MRIRTAFLIYLLLRSPLAGSEITSLWTGGTGDWTNPAQWSPAGVPNNGANTYLVTVNSGAVDVVNLFTQTVYLDGITIGSQSTVNVNDQGLVLGSPSSLATMLTNAGNIALTNAANLTLDFSAGATATNSSTISVGDESAIYLTTSTALGGTLKNTGSIALQANPHGSQIYLYGDGATFALSGGGNLTLSDNAANLISGSFGTESLISDNKFSGAGTVTMLANFTNNGTMTANGVNPLVFNMDNGTSGVTGTISNNGSIEAVSGSALVLQGSADLGVTNNGTISLNAQGAHASVLLYNDNNTGSALHLSGTGGLTLSDNLNNIVSGANGDETLVNEAGHTISGAGTISNFKVIDNGGVITANGTNPLILSLSSGPTPHGDLVNSGTLQVNDGSTLVLRADGTLINNSGSINLNAKNGTSTLLLDDGGLGGQFTISSASGVTGGIALTDNPGNRILGTGGTEALLLGSGQQISGAGTIGNFNVLSNQGTIIASGTNPLILSLSGSLNLLVNSGTLQVNDGSSMQFRSAGIDVNNEGLIALNAANGTSTLSFDDSGVGALFSISNTVMGGGKITLSDNPGNRIVGVNGTESLFLGGGQQLSGAGTIGNFSFLDNHGAITANGTHPLLIGLSNTANPFGNMENAGAINVSDGSTIVINSGAWINNVGSINLNAGALISTLAFNNTQPILLGSATSAGQLVLSDNPGNRIVGVTGQETLINNTAHTIQGAGTISNFGGGLVNNGLLLANGVNPLVIDISAATAQGNAGVTTGGIMEVGNGSTLQILSASGGTVLTTGTGEILLASVPTGNSTLSFNDQGRNGTFTLDSLVPGGSATVVMTIGGNRIAGVSGDETLINGAHSEIVGQGTIANFAGFTNLGELQTGGGVLEVAAPLINWNPATATLTGGTYAAAGGLLKLDSLGSQTITNLTGADVYLQGAGAITGSGTVNALSGLANVTNSSILLDSASALTITPTGGALILTNSNVTARGASLAIDGSVSVTTTSTLSTLSGGSVTINGNLFTDAASTIDVGNSTSLAASDFFNDGTIVLNAASTAAFKGAVSNSGGVIITAGAQFDVLKSPFLMFGTNIYTQTAGNTKVLTGGFLNAATVDLDGGTLGGGGTIAANIVVNGGTLEPGDPTTTHITGDLTIDAGEIVLDIDGIAPGTFDSLYIDGNLHIAGGTLDVVFEDGFVPQIGDTWNLFSFTGTHDGAGFAQIVFGNAGNLQLESSFNGGNFELEAPGTGTVPEPSTLPILLALLAGIGLCRIGKLLRRPRTVR